MTSRKPMFSWVSFVILLVVLVSLFVISCEMTPQGQTAAARQNPGTAVGQQEQAKPETPQASEAQQQEQKETGKEEKTVAQKDTPSAPAGFAKIGEWPWIIPFNTYNFYNYGKILVSAYEYPDWQTCGKLQKLRVLPGHNNQTIKPAGCDINLGYDLCGKRYIHGGSAINKREIHCPGKESVYHVSFDRRHYTDSFVFRQDSDKPKAPKEPHVGHKGDVVIECDSFVWCDTTVFCDTLDVGIAQFPVEREMLLVVTLDHTIPLSGAKVRWTFMDPKGARYGYGKEKAVSVDIIKGAGVPEVAAQLSRDQIITEFGKGPVYPQLPQTVDALGPKSGAPVDKIEIAPNQSWVLVRGFESGVSKVFVTIVHPQNYTFPGMEYAIRWVKPIPPVHPDFNLRVNITEARPEQTDPYVFNTQQDQRIKWKIAVVDETDYYINPADNGIIPIEYAVNYDLRLRRDPIQWDSSRNWNDCYALFLDPQTEPDPAAFHMNRLIYECKYQKAIPAAEPVVINYTQFVTASGNTFAHTGYSIFKAHQSTHNANGGYNKNWGDVCYWLAQQKAVDVSLRYVECDTFRCGNRWNHISDESITLEFKPGDEIGISGLQVEYLGTTKDGYQQVQLTNTGSDPVYEVYLEKPDGRKRAIAHMIPGQDAGAAASITIWEAYGMNAKENLPIQRGDWIWYYVYSIDNVARPVVAQQKRVRVQ